jgi:hypothetical protein
MRELYRVLSLSGTLAFSELLTDPDYSLAQTLVHKAGKVNFQLKKKLGKFVSYTLVFEKPSNVAEIDKNWIVSKK